MFDAYLPPYLVHKPWVTRPFCLRPLSHHFNHAMALDDLRPGSKVFRLCWIADLPAQKIMVTRWHPKNTLRYMRHKPFCRDNHDNPKHETGRVTFSRGTNPDHGRCLPPQRVVTPLRADVVGERFPFREFATGRFNKTNIGWFLYVPMDNGVSTNLNRWSSIKQMGSIYIYDFNYMVLWIWHNMALSKVDGLMIDLVAHNKEQQPVTAALRKFCLQPWAWLGPSLRFDERWWVQRCRVFTTVSL